MTDTTRQEIKNRIKEASDIIAVIGEVVELRKAGNNFVGLCPFHAEKTPSFSVNPQGQFFHCFGCGESGDVFSFLMKYHRLDFPNALKELARRYHIDLPERQLSDHDKKKIQEREQLFTCNEKAAVLYRSCLKDSPLGAEAREYLAGRGVAPEMADIYGLGYVPPPETGGWDFIIQRLSRDKVPLAVMEKAGLAVRKDRGGYYDRFRDRVLFPIYDMSGRVVAFGGRILGQGKPKYMNSPESPIFDKSRLLFGLYQHREAIRRKQRAVVVEGNFDLLLLAVNGIDNVVAPLGTSLTRQHIKSLRGYSEEVILLFDGDSAGLKAAMRSIPFFLNEQVQAKIALLPEGHDPDSLVRKQGTSAVENLLEHAVDLAEFCFSSLAEQYGLTLDGKAKIIHELRDILQAAPDRQQTLLASHFSEKLGVAPEQLQRPASRKLSPAANGVPAPSGLNDLPRKQRQLADFLFLYPEMLPVLQEAGLGEIELAPVLCRLLDAIINFHDAGKIRPEDLLTCFNDEGDRSYIARLLMHGANIDDSAEEKPGRQMCDEVITWIRLTNSRKILADLQVAIAAAQSRGDNAALMKLLAEKQSVVKKFKLFPLTS